MLCWGFLFRVVDDFKNGKYATFSVKLFWAFIPGECASCNIASWHVREQDFISISFLASFWLILNRERWTAGIYCFGPTYILRIQYLDVYSKVKFSIRFLTGRPTISCTTRRATDLLKTGPEIWSTFIEPYVCWSTFKLWTMLKQLLNGNNGLLLILTPNITDLSLTCHRWRVGRLDYLTDTGSRFTIDRESGFYEF